MNFYFQSKIRDYLLKSPGIKMALSRHMNTMMKGGDKNHMSSSSSSPVPNSRSRDDGTGADSDHTSIVGTSPPSLSPPNSPGPQDSVFTTVFIPTPSK